MKRTHTKLVACSQCHQVLYRNGWGKLWVGSLTILFQVSLFCGAILNTSLAAATPVESSPHQVKLLEIPLQKGNVQTPMTFPLYEQQGIQYFSAGLGKEERSLTYPPFPLKLIFVQGERAFSARVSIHIAKEDGSQLLSIPGEEVDGPWLFINLPIGTYVVSGTNSEGTTIKKTTTVKPDKSVIVHFRWP